MQAVVLKIACCRGAAVLLDMSQHCTCGYGRKKWSLAAVDRVWVEEQEHGSDLAICHLAWLRPTNLRAHLLLLERNLGGLDPPHHHPTHAPESSEWGLFTFSDCVTKHNVQFNPIHYPPSPSGYKYIMLFSLLAAV